MTIMKDKQQIFQTLSDILVDEFEIEPQLITPEALLYEELDLDSIDAVDLIIRLQEITGKKVSIEDFGSIRSINDITTMIESLIDS